MREVSSFDDAVDGVPRYEASGDQALLWSRSVMQMSVWKTATEIPQSEEMSEPSSSGDFEEKKNLTFEDSVDWDPEADTSF